VISKNTYSQVNVSRAEKGFVLLEALVAITVIVGAWIALLESYHSLVLQHGQLQAKKTELRTQADSFEIDEYLRANVNSETHHDSSRLLSRTHAQHDPTQPPVGNRRQMGQ
jgi:Tfp pilus assembly protein PilE